MRIRNTIVKEVVFAGIGLHFGEFCSVTVGPCNKQGIWIKKINKSENKNTRALPVSELNFEASVRRTGFLLDEKNSIQTCEHLLSALYALGIDDALISASGGEIPILDGSAAMFANALLPLRTPSKNNLPIEPLEITHPIVIDDIAKNRFIGIFPHDKFRITAVIDYSGSPIGVVRKSCDIDDDIFMNEIAPARTFCLEREVEYLKSQGLIKGGSLENALVVGNDGPLNPHVEDFTQECVSHKILDIIGDMSFLGAPIKGHIVAISSGHELHQELVEKIRIYKKR